MTLLDLKQRHADGMLLINASEAAPLLNMDPNTIRFAARDGELPFDTICAKHRVKIVVASLINCLEGNNQHL